MEEEADFCFDQYHDEKEIVNSSNEYRNGEERGLFNEDSEVQNSYSSDDKPSEIVIHERSNPKGFEEDKFQYEDENDGKCVNRTSTTDEEGERDDVEYQNGLSSRRELSTSPLEIGNRISLDETGLKNNDNFHGRIINGEEAMDSLDLKYGDLTEVE